MKHKRSWHFYLFIILISAALGWYLLWNFTPVKTEIKTLLVKKLQPYLGELFLINDFSPGFNSLSFYKLRAADENATFSLELEEIRISFNPLKLIIHKFQIPHCITSVTLVNPKFNLYYSEKSAPAGNGAIPMEKLFQDIFSSIQKFPAINYISIEDGGIYLKTSGSKEFPLLNRLAGRVSYSSRAEQADLSLRGEFLGAANSSITLTGAVDFPARNLSADLILDECIITSNWPFWKLGFLQLENARLVGRLGITNRGFSPDSLAVEGIIRVRDFSIYIHNQHARAAEFNLRFSRRGVVIEPFACEIEDGVGEFSGAVPDLFRPEADWNLEVAQYSAANLKKSHSIFEYAYQGKIAGRAAFNGPFDSLKITANLRCPALLYAVVPFDNVQLSLKYNTQSKLMEFPYLRADFMKFRTQGTGAVDFVDHRIKLDLDSDITVEENYFSILDALNGGKIMLHTDFGGDFNAKLFGGVFKYQVHGQDSLFVKGRGPFILQDQFFDFALHSEELTDDFAIKGTVRNLFSDPEVARLEVNDFPALRFTQNPLAAGFLTGRAVNFDFTGPYNLLHARMNIGSRERRRDIFSVAANIHDIFMENQKIKGQFTASTAPQLLQGDFELAFSEEGMFTRIDAENLFHGELFSGARPEAPFQGNIRIERFSIADYLQNSPAMAAVFEEGVLHGEMAAEGTVNNPRLRFNLEATDFIVNRVGYYDTRFSGALENNLLNFDNFWVRLNGEQVFNADFAWDLRSDSLKLAIRAENVESNFLAETVFRDPEIIRGNFSYTITAAGPMSRPAVYGDVQIKNGLFKNNPFDTIILAFEDSVAAGEPYWELDNHLIRVRKFIYINHDEYTVEGEGIIGIDPDAPLNLRVSARGNVLAELPKLLPYFKNPDCEGNLSARIIGTRSRPALEEMRLQIFSGSLEFDGVIPPLTQLKAEVELAGAGNFIHIKTIEGLIGNRRARIFNLPEVTVDATRLAPWVFDEVGMNFGVLALETAEQGIPLAIPGMMEEGDIGYFAAAGKKPGEKFYFAGPPELPQARGTLTLYNCRVTFPFIGMYDDDEKFYEDNKVVDFLMNMRWDITALPGRNNHYFVKVPAYVGEVFMELDIDNASPGLDFTGRLVDESFRVEGEVESTRGQVEYLDVKFRVERFGAEFNRFEIFPEVYGRAYTTVRDSTGNFPRDIYLVLYVIDPVTKKEVSKGRWEDFRFKLVSRDEVTGETQEQVLSYLGYSVRNLHYKAGEVGLSMTENFLIRPLFRPIERQMERGLHVDYVRLRSNFTANLFYLSFQDRAQLNSNTFLAPNLNNNIDPALLLLHSSGITMGKYLLRDLYLTYTGELVLGYEESKLGVNHTLGLEYRLLYNLLFEVEWNKFQFNPFYNEQITNDFRFRFRHSFNF